MPRVKAKTPAKKRPFTPAPKKNKAKKPKKGLSKDRARWDIETQRQGEGSRKSKGKQRKVDHDFSNRPRDQPERSALLYSEPTMPPADIAWAVVDQDHPSLQHMYARADTFHSIPPLIPSTSSTSSPTAARFTNPIASIHHNTPLILCIVIGAVVVTATLSVGLAWILRLACCAGERRARRKCRLDRSTSSPSALASAIDSKSDNEKSVGRRSLDSVSLRGDDDLERKAAKIDALFDGETKDTQLGGAVPTLSYGDDVKVPEAPKSTWDGKGWTLFDPPVTGIQQPEPAVTASLAGNTRGGNYSAARQELANQDVGSFTWPSSMERQPSFIERLVQRHHQALELPTTAPLPYPFQAKPVQPASRMASLGGVANRAVMNTLPPTLRNAATTASRQRATRKRYHDMQPYLDSDFEGTIGGKDRELPIARRLRRTEERMAVDCTTEEESNSPLNTLPLYPGQFDDSLRFPRAQQVLMPSPMIPMTLINADSKAPVEFTPGLAGVGAACLQSAWQSSADLSIVSSVFDEEFAAQSTKRASSKKPSTKNDAEAISTAKAEADAAVRDAWRRHKLLSISSRGSQRIRTTRTTLTESEQVSALLSRAESMRSEPSIYSELTAASDYQFQAPLLSASCGASTFDPVSEDLDEAIEMLSQADDAKRKEETEALLKKQMKEEAKKEAKKEAKREHRRVERQQARDAAAA